MASMFFRSILGRESFIFETARPNCDEIWLSTVVPESPKLVSAPGTFITFIVSAFAKTRGFPPVSLWNSDPSIGVTVGKILLTYSKVSALLNGLKCNCLIVLGGSRSPIRSVRHNKTILQPIGISSRNNWLAKHDSFCSMAAISALSAASIKTTIIASGVELLRQLTAFLIRLQNAFRYESSKSLDLGISGSHTP